MNLADAIIDLQRSLAGAIRELQMGLVEAQKEIEWLRSAKDNSVIDGRVTDRDPKKHRIRIEIGLDDEGESVKSPWIPYSQIAGARKVHSVPSIGQQMRIVCPNGDPCQALAVPLTWWNDNPSPSEDGDEDIDLRGKTRRTQRDADIKTEVDGVTEQRTKQSHSLTIHKDPETQDEGKDEEVSDKKPWKGNRAKAKHTRKVTKDGGYVLTINEGDDQNEHKVIVKPTDDAVEISTHKGKHKIMVNRDEMKLSFDGQHETTYSSQGIRHKSSTKVQIESPQIEHAGDLKITGTLLALKQIQSLIGVKAPLLGGLPGDGGDATNW
jgi:phage baseplate assembly protein gpV